MTRHRMFNVMLVVAILTTLAAIQFIDSRDFEADMTAERREWREAVMFCHRTAGPQTQPEYDERGTLICVGKRGQRHNEVKVANK